MTATTYEKKKKTEQRINRNEMKLAQLKLNERRKRTRRLIEIGGLITKAGLSDYPKAVVLGAALALVEQLEREPALYKMYKAKGEGAFLGFSKNQTVEKASKGE